MQALDPNPTPKQSRQNPDSPELVGGAGGGVFAVACTCKALGAPGLLPQLDGQLLATIVALVGLGVVVPGGGGGEKKKRRVSVID
jgi:hypothetical protein